MDLKQQFGGKWYDGRKQNDPERDKKILKPGMTVLFRDRVSGKLKTSGIVAIGDQYEIKKNPIVITLQGLSGLYLHDCLQIVKPYEYPTKGQMEISECLLHPGRIADTITEQVFTFIYMTDQTFIL